ncbi:MAG: YdjY domain-containing protein [Akkermansiaceae bacterium]
MTFRISLCMLLAAHSLVLGDETRAAPEAKSVDQAAPADLRKVSPELKATLEKLVLPGVKINLEQWSADVESSVCLQEGLLELIACTRDTKEHESVLRVEAKPSHIHTALLLLGARPGSPAQQQAIDPEMTRFRSVPPSGSPVDVFIVQKDEKGLENEQPISEFIVRARGYDGTEETEVEAAKREKFPTHTFLFAGSVLVPDGDGPRRYVADETGSVITISTFGDELLCLSGFHGQDNESLVWEVDGEKMPALGTKVILRLRPQRPPGPADEGAKK